MVACWLLAVLSAVHTVLPHPIVDTVDGESSPSNASVPTAHIQFAEHFLREDAASPRAALQLLSGSAPLTPQHHARSKRRVHCGKSKNRREREPLTYEQRAVCSFRYVQNHDANRVPAVLEEVQCECERPSHVSTYSPLRCEPVRYRMPVLRRHSQHAPFESTFETLTLACVPMKPKDDDSGDFMVPIATSL